VSVDTVSVLCAAPGADHSHVAQRSHRDRAGWQMPFWAHLPPTCHVDPDVCDDEWLTEAYSLNRPCPSCAAAPGRPCTSPTGYSQWPMPVSHHARREARP
jgi:hypothetical protein